MGQKAKKTDSCNDRPRTHQAEARALHKRASRADSTSNRLPEGNEGMSEVFRNYEKQYCEVRMKNEEDEHESPRPERTRAPAASAPFVVRDRMHWT